MHTGILLYGLICQSVGVFFVERQLYYALGLWMGILLALLASIHMYRTLDRALMAEEAAAKMMFSGYMIRYAVLLAVLVLAALTEVMDPLILFLGYMSLKITAWIQPFTHKVFNRLFDETDPIPEALPPEPAEEVYKKEEENKEEYNG